ncbi:DNRLRE domain-containing protein [Posidoniimonas corsicana]|nr:DNRLRE domain-containing protein [Posidoniimonas corsicana]
MLLPALAPTCLLAADADRGVEWAPVCGDWEVRIDGGGEIYHANLNLEITKGPAGAPVAGTMKSEGRTGRLRSAKRSKTAYTLTFATRRSGVPTEVTFAFNRVGGKLVGEVDFQSGGGGRSYEFEATRLDAAPAAPAVTTPPKQPQPVAVRRVAFRQGEQGYSGAIDTEIWGIAPSKSLDRQGTMTSDSNNGGGESQVLMRFGGVIGDGEHQVPAGSRVRSAKLTVVVFDPGTTVFLHRVLAPWDESATWDRMSGGLRADDLEASTLRDGFSFGEINMDRQLVEFDVTATAQRWADGEPNYGWVFINTGGNGWDFYSSDWVERDIRPRLEIEFEPRGRAADTPVAGLDRR